MRSGSFAKGAHLYVPKNDTLGAWIKILRPYLQAKH